MSSVGKDIIEILPGILENEWIEIEKKLNSAKEFAKSIHVDLMDGKMTPSKTFLDPQPFSKYANDLLLEVHMMVENPIRYLKPFADSGFKRFLGHVEMIPQISEFVAKGQLLGEVGLALDGPTEIDVLHGINLEDLDSLLIYTSDKIGFSGPPMMPDRLEKIRKLRCQTDIPIEADGGVKDTTILSAYHAGAKRFVATSYIWGSENPKSAFERLRGIIEE